MSRSDKDRDDRDDRPATKAEKKPPVIELHHDHGLTAGEAFLKRLLPAAVVSAGIHLLIAVGAFLVSILVPVTTAAPPVARVDMAVEEKTETPRDENLTETMVTIDDKVGPTGVQDVPLAEVNIDTELNKNTDPVGAPDGQVQEKLDTLKLVGAPSDLDKVSGIEALGPNAGMPGAGDKGVAMVNPGLQGRKPGSRDAMVKTGGGNTESEAAVARGLAWLARVQKKDGTWAYEGGGDMSAATGMGLLPFLAAGQTHKGTGKDNKYKDNVTAGIAALLKMQKSDGSFSENTYAHAIATVALCEAFGMTGDKALLLKPCQLAVDRIQKNQGKDGSWGYKYGDEGDTSIVGWQVQALHSAKMCKEIRVDPKVMERAMKFLDTVASKPPKVVDETGKTTFGGASSMSAFGYKTPGPRPSLTAVGLLCRYYLNGWGPNSPGLRDGVDYLVAAHSPKMYPAAEKKYDMYYYYYATQVAHFREGEVWAKDWNPKMRDMLIAKQVKEPNRPTVDGSWDKDEFWVGDACGRLGTTAMAILTLEVYYRHLPLYGRGTGALNELDRK